MNEHSQPICSVVYDKPTATIALENDWDSGAYPAVMTSALVEAFTALEGWCVPLAVALVFRRTGDSPDKSTPTLLLRAAELTNEIQLQKDWPTWATPMPVDSITGELVRTVIHDHLETLATEHESTFELYGTRFMACRYAIGPELMPADFNLTEESGDVVRTIRTTTSDGKRWVSEPQVDTHSLLPVNVEITGTQGYDNGLGLNLSPQWSFFGDEDSPGWSLLVEATDRLLAQSDQWSIALRRSRKETRH